MLAVSKMIKEVPSAQNTKEQSQLAGKESLYDVSQIDEIQSDDIPLDEIQPGAEQPDEKTSDSTLVYDEQNGRVER